MKTKFLRFKKAMRAALFVLLLNAVGLTKSYAYDFSAVCETGQTLYYNITSATNHTVALSSPGPTSPYLSYSYSWSGYTKPTGDIIIPGSVQYEGVTYLVTSIGSCAFYHCSGLTGNIIIPNSVVSIGDAAFYNCMHLTGNLTIPNSVTSIGISAFSDCSGFTGSLTIPNSVTSIGYGAFRSCSGLTSIVISNSVTSIDYDTFANCSGLTFVEIPNSVTSIGQSAFENCSGLTSIEIPNSVTSIGVWAFSSCSGLTSIEIPNSVTSIGYGAFRSCSGLTSMIVLADNPPTSDNIFSFMNMEIPVYVPCESVDLYTTTNWGGFSNFIGLCAGEITVTANPTIGGSVDGGGYYEDGTKFTLTATANTGYSFVNWAKDGVWISNSETYSFYVTGDAYYEAIFAQTASITFVDDSVKSLCVTNWDTNGDGELSYAEAAAVTSLGEVFKNNSNINSFDELQYFVGLTSIGYEAFWHCSGLTSIEIPNSVTYIGNNAFYHCSGLTSIEIPNSVTSIGESAFGGCSGLTSIEIPNSMTTVSEWAFFDCIGLTSIVIPNSVTSIGSHAFLDCSGLTSVTVLANNPPTLDQYAFNYGNTLIPVYVPCGSVELYTMSNWSYFFSNFIGLCGGEITVTINPIEGGTVTGGGNYGNEEICTLTATADPGYYFIYWTRDGVVVSDSEAISFYVWEDASYVAFFAQDTTINFADANVEALCVANWDTDGDGKLNYVEAAAVTSLGEVFKNNSIITSFDELRYFIELTSIGSYAFENCSGLTSIEIPNSVTYIGNNAFYHCSGLTSIDIPNSVTSIRDDAFSNCSGLTSIVIPNSVTYIGSYAFYHCSGLTSMTVLANNPPTLGFYAFNGVNKSIPVYVPCGIEEVYASASWDGFSNFIGLCGGEITVTANPVEGGTVTGGGIFGIEAICTLTATANPGYYFTYWTRDGVVVSNSETYSFYVWDDASYVAGFAQGTPITFADANVEAICLVNWDTDHDGKLSTGEAAAVTNLGTVFRNKSNITTFDELQYFVGLTSIDNYAFESCSSLTSIVIPNSVTSIGSYAFSRCYGLTSIVIPNSVTSIGNYVFSWSNSLEQIIVDSGNTVYDSRENCNAVIETSTNELVVGCKNTVIPNSVTSIGDYAFSNCSGLTSIEIPNSVTSIGSMAFYYCSGLTSIELPNSVTSIGSSAFSLCRLTSIELPNSVTSIGSSAFFSCPLTSIEIPSSVTYIGGSLCTGLQQIIVDPENTVYDSRDNCNAIINTATNELVTGCKNTVIPNSVTSIGDRAFNNCSGLTSIEIPNSVTSIGSQAFSSCYDLTFVVIPNSVTSIGFYAFSSCSGLTSLTVFANNPPTLSSSFIGVDKSISVYVPCESVETYTSASWSGFNSFIGFCGGTVTVAANPEEGGMVTGGGIVGADQTCTVTAIANEGYAFAIWTQEGRVVSADAEYTFYVPSDMELVAQFVPDANITFADANVKSLCVANWDTNGDGELSYVEAAMVTKLDQVFKNNTTLISFDELQYFIGLTSIGYNAFYHCSGLASIVIPNSVTSIGSYAFDNCSGLTSIEIPNSVTSIGSYAFYHCSGLTSIEIPNSVTSIGSCAFAYSTGLTSITSLAQNPPTLGYSAFSIVDKSIPVYVPCVSMYAYQNTSMWDEFVNITSSIVCNSGEIIVTSNTAEGGTVTGGGYFEGGAVCTLTATANTGYYFNNWTKEGMEVSSSDTYSFNVDGDAIYVANFEQGVAIGSGTATNQYLPSYSNYKYSLSQQIYTAEEIGSDGAITSVDFFNAGATKTRSYNVYMVHTDKLSFENSTDWITVTENDLVFSGEVTMTADAWTRLQFDTPFQYNGISNIALIVDDNSGNYTGSPHMACSVFHAQGNQAIRIYSDVTNYDPYNPSSYSGTLHSEKNQIRIGFASSPSTITQTTNLSRGWNWYSTYIEQEGIDGLGQLENSISVPKAIIQSQGDGYVKSVLRNGRILWGGALSSINNEEMYKIGTKYVCTATMEGYVTDPAIHPITINKGWNWIGFPCDHSVSVSEAFSGFTPRNKDVIKGLNSYATYRNGAWVGTLNTLEPGQGYMYGSGSNAPKTLVFQTSRGEATLANITPENNYHQPVDEYADNMTLIAVIELDGEELRSEDYELAAFVNDECRGSVKLMYVEPINRYVAFLTVFGDETEDLYFVLTDGADMNQSEDYVRYETDGMVGSLGEPVTLRFGTLGLSDGMRLPVHIYPNPSKDVFNIEGVGIRKVEVTNAYGQIILSEEVESDNLQINLSDKAAGAYLLRVVTDKGVATKKLVKE